MYVHVLSGANRLNFESSSHNRYQKKEKQALHALVWSVNFDSLSCIWTAATSVGARRAGYLCSYTAQVYIKFISFEFLSYMDVYSKKYFLKKLNEESKIGKYFCWYIQ